MQPRHGWHEQSAAQTVLSFPMLFRGAWFPQDVPQRGVVVFRTYSRRVHFLAGIFRPSRPPSCSTLNERLRVGNLHISSTRDYKDYKESAAIDFESRGIC